MKSSLLTAIIFTSLALTSGAEERLAPGSTIPWADPTIFVENGRYYLTGTNNSNLGGFQLLES
ncbi:MAG: beta-xylosidase, partial [Muribaculaceae bacterium]